METEVSTLDSGSSKTDSKLTPPLIIQSAKRSQSNSSMSDTEDDKLESNENNECPDESNIKNNIPIKRVTLLYAHKV
jgi:hypothetical protein